jgi:S1-C subfamily serine protease
VPVGTTPPEKKFPGGYFHRTKTAFGDRLEHPMIARVSLPGYTTHEIALTEGPMEWIDLHGRHHGQYWLFKIDHFHVDLQTVRSTFTGSVSAATALEPAELRPVLSLEQLTRQTKPAVVCLKSLSAFGSGFFVTETGIIATNAHVARGDSSLLALLADGMQLEANVVYIDENLDLALIKAASPSPDYRFPYLSLADASLVQPGESVLVIGNPGDAMLFSVTKGIVSGVGTFPAAGPGTWIQTDAPINPGNSGGPLLNTRGEVIGLNTLKLVKKNISGIGFALSAGDLLQVLSRFYPDLAPHPKEKEVSVPSPAPGKNTRIDQVANPPVSVPLKSSTPSESTTPSTSSVAGFGALTITSDFASSEISVDANPLGSSPAYVEVSAGYHYVLVTCPGRADYTKKIYVPALSKLTVKGCS